MLQREFGQWFHRICGHPSPRDWQIQLANCNTPRSQLIRIPTGFGKTQGVLAAWSFHRVAQTDKRWPRRLVWCLPMRVLVEQTYQSALEISEKINSELGRKEQVVVHQAMGGEDTGDWFLYPERYAIIIGTQDMLLSRALNRGYGSSRARWPIEYGLLNHNTLWVMDEVQLMDIGLATSAQLQAYREQTSLKLESPCYTWWMSATLQPNWLSSVDTEKALQSWTEKPCMVSATDRTGGLFDIKKTLRIETIDAKESKKFAELIIREHRMLDGGPFGRVSLVVCNTVKRACDTYDQICAIDKDQTVELVHSRFRPQERKHWRKAFLSKDACTPDSDRIIIATQVVEAGVDISAGCLISEIAPWPNLVQRFGRCARYGGAGKVVVVNRGCDTKSSLPYDEEQLIASLESLQKLSHVGIAELEAYEESLSEFERQRLFPYEPKHLLLRSEFEDLFDTTPDLTGADIDISRFIRSGDERDLQIFWVDLKNDQVPSEKRQPQREELCAVKFIDAANWLCGEETKSSRKPNLKDRMQKKAWVWDWIDGSWVTVKRTDLLPGRIVCVACDKGGYTQARGFDPDSVAHVPEVAPTTINELVDKANTADSRQGSEMMSFKNWKTLAFHSQEVEQIVIEISGKLELGDELGRILGLAAKWHDIGKSHPAFQSMLRAGDGTDSFANMILAKSGLISSSRPRYFADIGRQDERVGFRHELASALALFSVLRIYQPQHPGLLGEMRDWLQRKSDSDNFIEDTESNIKTNTTFSCPSSVRRLLDCSAEDFDLLLYLVASHHGKVRVALHASPNDQDYRDCLRDGRGLPIRGIREGDRLPPTVLDMDSEPIAELVLTLEPAALGLSQLTGRSWRERMDDLKVRFGPTQLAYLESILRAADVRASQLNTLDPMIKRD
jgi:CRISPR-associated endonuclease/helicase Cas3